MNARFMYNLLISFFMVVLPSCVEDKNRAVASNACVSKLSPEKKFLVVSPTFGLGNRLRALASAHVMAKVTGRELIVDWQTEDKVLPARFNELFANPIKLIEEAGFPQECTAEIIRGSYHAPMSSDISRYYERWGDGREERFYREYSQIPDDPAKIVYVNTCMNFFPASLSFDAFINDYIQFYRDLRPAKEVAAIMERIGKQIGDVSNMVGVHYRAWKSTNDNPSLRPDIDLVELFVSEMKKHGGAKFFVATDDVVGIEVLKAKIGTDRIANAQIAPERTSVGGQRTALAEWFLLSKTKYIIGTLHSSFSDEAALLSLERRKINIGPPQFCYVHSTISFDMNGIPYRRPHGEESGC